MNGWPEGSAPPPRPGTPVEVMVFAKAPRPGRVKTRLAATIGPTAAVDLYRTVGLRVVREVARVSNITVWFDPPDARCEVRAWLGEYRLEPQIPGDLGARLHHAFTSVFEQTRGTRVIAIGADAPDVDGAVIVQAAHALQGVDVVIGPAIDGGYYLIGLAQQPRPELFRAIPWSTDRVLEATQSACRRAGLTMKALPPLRDIDTVEDAVACGLWPP